MLTEGPTVEFKRQFTKNIRFTAAAFANTDGGTLYIGIEDDGTVCGVENADVTLRQVTDLVRNTILPDLTLQTSCEAVKMEGKDVVVLTVTRGLARPYYLDLKGPRPEGVYVRHGASSVPASHSAILQMIRETYGEHYEDEPSVCQELTFNKTLEFFSRKGLPFGEAQQRTLHVIGSNGMYSNLALLLSEQCPHIVKTARFQGSTKTVFRDRKEHGGSLLQQLESVFAYIENINFLHAEVKGLFRVDKYDYPAEAVREALLNALIHRDYTVNSPILVSVYDDRIEILSVGGLLSGITYRDIRLGVSAARNPHLAEVFYRLELVEAYGTGLRKIDETYAGEPVKPKIELGPNAFRLTLPNRNFVPPELPPSSGLPPVYAAPMPASANVMPLAAVPACEPMDITDRERAEKILAFLQTRTVCARSEVDTLLGVSQSTSGILLRKMVRLGLLQATGHGRSVRYALSQAGASAQSARDYLYCAEPPQP